MKVLGPRRRNNQHLNDSEDLELGRDGVAYKSIASEREVGRRREGIGKWFKSDPDSINSVINRMLSAYYPQQQSAGELKEIECDIYLAQDEEGN